MRVQSKILLIAALLTGMAGSSFADTYSSSSSSVVTSGPRVSAPMAPAMNSGMISDPSVIRSCLCLQSQYQKQEATVSAKQTTYTQAMNQKASLDSMVAGAKAGTGDLAQVRQASENSIILQNNINQAYLPDLQNATAQYNQSVAAYDQSCGGKSFDADVLAQAKNGLVCPGG
jgi:phosphopantothenoylcysteine synthetase/decarboxylase